MNRAQAVITSPLGNVLLQGSEAGLERLDFIDDREAEIFNLEILASHVAQLNEFFDGTRESFNLLLLPLGTHFQMNVWDELSKIPYANTWSYERLAIALGDIKTIRAAATANGRNPLPIIIPCHRVIGKSGELSGYSGGVWRKRWLIEHEQRNVQPKISF